MKPRVTRLAGVTHGDAQANINNYGGPGIGDYDLVREPDNPQDPNAIRVAFLEVLDLGYVPASEAAILAPLMDAGRKFVAEFVSVNRHPLHETIGMTVRIVEVKLQKVVLVE